MPHAGIVAGTAQEKESDAIASIKLIAALDQVSRDGAIKSFKRGQHEHAPEDRDHR